MRLSFSPFEAFWFGEAISNQNPQSREEILAAMREGGKLSLMTAAPGIVMRNAGQVVDAVKFGQAEPLSKYLNSSDKLYRHSAKIKPIDGYEDIIIHGDKNGFTVRDKDDIEFMNYTPWQLAEILREDPNYHGGAIRLVACELGKEEFGAAQMLANRLGIEVLAPTDTVWVMPDGEIRIGSEAGANDGTWRIFKPRR